MRKIVLFSFVYQCLFSLISLISQILTEDFNQEMYSYFFYLITLYFIIGFFINILLIKCLLIFKRGFYILFILGVIVFFNIYIYIIWDRVILFGRIFNFNIAGDIWYIAFSYHLSIILSTLIMMFLVKIKVLKLR
jgi:hypothetical protein